MARWSKNVPMGNVSTDDLHELPLREVRKRSVRLRYNRQR